MRSALRRASARPGLRLSEKLDKSVKLSPRATMPEHEHQAISIPGLTPGQLCYLQIPALDITASARFYERVLGWRVDPPGAGFEAPGLIGQWVTERAAAPDVGPVGWIHVGDVRRTLQTAREAGGTPRDEPVPDGPRLLASFSDPAGNLVGIVQHEPTDWQPAAPRCAASQRATGHSSAPVPGSPVQSRTM